MKNDDKKRLTCYECCSKKNVQCQKNECNHWISFSDGLNCSIICSKRKKLTFKEIGNMFGLTRMRICQIEKNALNKIRYSIIRRITFQNLNKF